MFPELVNIGEIKPVFSGTPTVNELRCFQLSQALGDSRKLLICEFLHLGHGQQSVACQENSKNLQAGGIAQGLEEGWIEDRTLDRIGKTNPFHFALASISWA